MIGIYLYLKNYDGFQLKERIENLLRQYGKGLKGRLVLLREATRSTLQKTNPN